MSHWYRSLIEIARAVRAAIAEVARANPPSDLVAVPARVGPSRPGMGSYSTTPGEQVRAAGAERQGGWSCGG